MQSGHKYCYLTHHSIEHYFPIHLHTVKWFQVLLGITNNLIKHQSFVCTQFKCQTVLFDPQIGPYQVLPLQVKVDPGVMAMKVCSIFPKALILAPYHQIV